jgi:hypothetical protein
MNIPDKVVDDQYLSSEFTEFKNEVQNAETSSGQALASNSIQLKQAMARYASGGASYTDSGIADAYSLEPLNAFDKINVYRHGDMLAFKAGNDNTGASTLAVSGVGSAPILKNGLADPLIAGDIRAGKIYEVFYDSSSASWELLQPAGAVHGSNANGEYLIYPNGLIQQWGTKSTFSAGQSKTVTLPLAYLSTSYQVIQSIGSAGDNHNASYAFSKTTTTFGVRNSDTGSGVGAIYWITMGY